MVKRGKIPKNDAGEYWHWKDLDVGKDICIYGKVFHTVSCDLYTKVRIGYKYFSNDVTTYALGFTNFVYKVFSDKNIHGTAGGAFGRSYFSNYATELH